MLRPMQPEQARSVLHVEGCSLSYRVLGSGPHVVFIQGIGLHGDGWQTQTRALAEHMRCLSFDNRGMAHSQPLSGSLSVPLMARDTLALMDQEGWASAHLVGHSLGSLVAIEAAALAPTRVRSLTLMCAVLRGRDATRITWPIVQLGMAAKFGTKRMARRAFLKIVMPRAALTKVDPDEVAASLEAIFGHDLAEQPSVVDHQLRALRAYDATNRLGLVAAIPSLVISATEDPVAPPRYGRELSESLPGCRYVEISGAAHGVTVTHAERINALLKEHVLKVEQSLQATSAQGTFS